MDIYSQDYFSSGSTVSIVKHFLSVYTREEITDVPPSCKEFQEKNYDIRRAFVARPLRSTYLIKSIIIKIL